MTVPDWAVSKAAELRATQGLPAHVEDPAALAALRTLKRS